MGHAFSSTHESHVPQSSVSYRSPNRQASISCRWLLLMDRASQPVALSTCFWAQEKVSHICFWEGSFLVGPSPGAVSPPELSFPPQPAHHSPHATRVCASLHGRRELGSTPPACVMSCAVETSAQDCFHAFTTWGGKLTFWAKHIHYLLFHERQNSRPQSARGSNLRIGIDMNLGF